VNPLVKAVNILKTLSPEQFRLAVILAKPDNPRRKKPGPKPGSKRKKVGTPVPPKNPRSRRIEPSDTEEEG
jgi:hypothetical protein